MRTIYSQAFTLENNGLELKTTKIDEKMYIFMCLE